MKLRLTHLAERLGTSYWLLPTLCVAVAIGLSHAAQAIDARLPQEQHAWYLFYGGPEGARSVLSLSVWIAVVLAVLCVGTFIYYIHHVAQSIRAVVIISRIRDETHHTLERMYPEGVGEDTEEAHPEKPEGPPSLLVMNPGTSGVLVAVDDEQLFSCARKADVTLVLVPLVGDFVPHGATLFAVWGEASELGVEALLDSLVIGPERTLQQDTAFGFRQLVDIAERALSPGIKDPTTAVQDIDAMHDLLRRMVGRRFPSPAREDEGGTVRLLCPRPDWSAHVRPPLALSPQEEAHVLR